MCERLFVPLRKPYERKLARELRLELGMPMKQIASRLGVSVSSVHLWTGDIELSEDQSAINLRAAGEKRAQQWVAVNRRRRAGYQDEGRARARQQDPLHRAGCMLYWAEGGKERNAVTFANSDRAMLRYFVRFLRDSMAVPASDMTIRLNVYLSNGLRLREIEDSWLGDLGLTRSSLRKHQLDHHPTSSSGKRPQKLPYGVCTIRVKRSTQAVQHIFGAIQEYGGFDEPRWLDGPPRKPRAPKSRLRADE